MRLVNAWLVNIPGKPRGAIRPAAYPPLQPPVRRLVTEEVREHRPPPPPAAVSRPPYRPAPGPVRREFREEVRAHRPIPGPVRREIREEVREEVREALREQEAWPVRQAVREEARERLVDNSPWIEDPWREAFGDELNTQVAPGDQVLTQAVGQAVAQLQDGYGPLAQMSPNLRIQAASGYRAGVIRLKNGMFLVVEIHQSALEPQFGAAEVLAPMVVNAAVKALENPNLQKAVVDTTALGIQAMGRGFSQLGRNHPRRPHPHPLVQRAQAASRLPSPVRPLVPPPYQPWAPPYTPAYGPGYAPLYAQTYAPGYPPPVASPYPTLPQAASLARRQAAAQRREEILSEALPWAEYEDLGTDVGL